jgi:hypothetical protein
LGETGLQEAIDSTGLEMIEAHKGAYGFRRDSLLSVCDGFARVNWQEVVADICEYRR